MDMTMMVIYGYSDDLVEFEGVLSATDETLDPSDYYADEFESAKNVMGPGDGAEFNVILRDDELAVFQIGPDPGEEFAYGCTQTILLEARYDGRWSFAPAQLDYTNKFPDWDVAISQSEESDNSTKVTILLPEDKAHVKRII